MIAPERFFRDVVPEFRDVVPERTKSERLSRDINLFQISSQLAVRTQNHSLNLG